MDSVDDTDPGLAGLSPEFQAMLGGLAGHTASFAKILETLGKWRVFPTGKWILFQCFSGKWMGNFQVAMFTGIRYSSHRKRWISDGIG
jgi:hypothetical protein